MRLQDRVAIVTGAGSGMGEAIAHTYAREGAKVAVLDVNEQAANKVANAIGASALAVACDVTNRAGIARAVEMTEKKFGVTDILVNNAGVAHVNKPLMEIDEREYDRVFDVNVKGLFMFIQAVVLAMRKKREV